MNCQPPLVTHRKAQQNSAHGALGFTRKGDTAMLMSSNKSKLPLAKHSAGVSGKTFIDLTGFGFGPKCMKMPIHNCQTLPLGTTF